MAITEGSTTLSGTAQRRTFAFKCQTPFGLPAQFEALRERIILAADGSFVARENAAAVFRTIDAALLADSGQTVKLADGTTIALAQLVEAVAAFVDKWDAADRAAPVL